ncbi:MAG: hypothetical protein KatS3mg008_1313 [Acidimicrobiales bacterium]|nr:MAG: hypothetical protein KatS3mg008_1313 [Acidimicrobiales bacterium]
MSRAEELRVGANVVASDGEAGRLDALVVDPVREAVTHLVVDERGRPTRRLVPIGKVADADPGEVRLACSREELAAMEPFDEYRYLRPDEAAAVGSDALVLDPGFYFLEPYAVPVDPGLVEGLEKVPPDEVAFHRGAEVVSADGERLGLVDEFLVHPSDGSVTHVILRKGHVFRKADVVIPISSVEKFEEDKVRLGLTRQEVERLPHIPTRRGRHLSSEETGVAEIDSEETVGEQHGGRETSGRDGS